MKHQDCFKKNLSSPDILGDTKNMFFEGFFFLEMELDFPLLKMKSDEKKLMMGHLCRFPVFFFPVPIQRADLFEKRPDVPEDIEKNPENFSIITFRRRGSLSF